MFTGSLHAFIVCRGKFFLLCVTTTLSLGLLHGVVDGVV